MVPPFYPYPQAPTGMAYITNLTATTELEAVNAMFAAIGEAPITDLSSPAPDVQMALNVLRDTTREVLNRKWRFNTDLGYELQPSATFAWPDTTGNTPPTLNIFKPPVNLASFLPTNMPKQQGYYYTDLVIAPSRRYTEGTPAAPVLVFYDRGLNRDGLDSTYYPSLFIDAVWYFDFQYLPDIVRRYITIRAARKYLRDTVGAETLVGLQQQDEMEALKALAYEHGLEDSYNIFNQLSVSRILGFRPLGPSGSFTGRPTPGYKP